MIIISLYIIIHYTELYDHESHQYLNVYPLQGKPFQSSKQDQLAHLIVPYRTQLLSSGTFLMFKWCSFLEFVI